MLGSKTLLHAFKGASNQFDNLSVLLNQSYFASTELTNGMNAITTFGMNGRLKTVEHACIHRFDDLLGVIQSPLLPIQVQLAIVYANKNLLSKDQSSLEKLGRALKLEQYRFEPLDWIASSCFPKGKPEQEITKNLDHNIPLSEVSVLCAKISDHLQGGQQMELNRKNTLRKQ